MPGQGPSFPRPKDARGSDLPWSVELTTDDKGEAQLLFCPAPVGGDRYRFSVAVKDPLAPDRDLATYESGDVVVWRTVRVSRHLQMPNVAQPKDLPSSLRGYLETNGVDLARAARALDPLDVKHLARELARGYVDCIVEQAALAPEPFKKEHWDDFLATFAEHERDFSNVVNCSTWVNEKRRFEVALKPDPTNKKRVFRGTFPARSSRAWSPYGRRPPSLPR